LNRWLISAIAAVAPLVSGQAHAEEMRSFGVGTGGGYGWSALTTTSGVPASATGAAPIYPPLELQFFNDQGASFDLSLPVGAIIDAAANGYVDLGATAFYTPQLATAGVRGIVSPGLGFGYDRKGPRPPSHWTFHCVWGSSS